MGLIKVWQVRGMGEDFFGYFFMEKKRRERGNREKKERKSKKERDNMMQICNISSRTFLRMLNFWLDYAVLRKVYKFY